MNYHRRKKAKLYGRKNRTRTSGNLKTDGLGEESQINHKLVENRTRQLKERKNMRHRYIRDRNAFRRKLIEWEVTPEKQPKRPGKKQTEELKDQYVEKYVKEQWQKRARYLLSVFHEIM